MGRKLVLAVVAVIVLAAAAGWWFLLRDDAPPPPDLATAAEVAAASQSTAVPATTTGPPNAMEIGESDDVGDPSGTWTVDTAIGQFGVNEASGTFVGFRVKEVLGQGIGSTTAVGRTPLVDGTVEIDGTTLVAAEIVADLTGLRTDRSMRDSKVRDALNTDIHPEATFVLAGPLDLGVGSQVQVIAPGSLTVNGVTNPVEVELAAELVGQILTVVGTIYLEFADHGIEAPTAPVVVSVEDHGVVEVQLFLTR